MKTCKILKKKTEINFGTYKQKSGFCLLQSDVLIWFDSVFCDITLKVPPVVTNVEGSLTAPSELVYTDCIYWGFRKIAPHHFDENNENFPG